jgi:hypothetical protein
MRLIGHQVENLMGVIDVESDGVPVRPQFFALHQAPPPRQDASVQDESPVRVKRRRESPAVYRHIEPRLQLISNLFGSINRCGRFDIDGKDARVDGFRLKNLRFWSRYPSTRLIDNFGELSTYCNCDCTFCFLNGSAKLSPKRPMLAVKEAKTRARYYSPETRTGLPTPSAPPGEPFTNPHAIQLLRIARASHPDHVIDITTNGDYLDEKTLGALAELQPIHISLSINSSNEEQRRRIMGSRRPGNAIRAMPVMRQLGIQFTGSIVPSPESPLADVAQTMRDIDRHAPMQIRLCLPGYTQYVGEAATFDTRTFWDSLIELATRLRPEIRSPLLIQPGFYWNKEIRAIIDGIFPNSPAERAGLRFGDRIIRVNHQPVVSRAEAVHLIEQFPDKNAPWTVRLEIERARRRFSVELSNELSIDEDLYPYKPKGYAACYESLARWGFGVQLMDGFDIGSLKRVKEAVERHPQARRILVFTTPLVKDLYAQALYIVGESPECRFRDVEVRATVARQNFWGGNIMVGDLHVVQDFIDHLQLLNECGYRPDLAIIPSSFTNSWGLDLLGHSFMDIERRTGVKVELVRVRRVMV